jgi:hypothetical protein
MDEVLVCVFCVLIATTRNFLLYVCVHVLVLYIIYMSLADLYHWRLSGGVLYA